MTFRIIPVPSLLTLAVSRQSLHSDTSLMVSSNSILTAQAPIKLAPVICGAGAVSVKSSVSYWSLKK